MKLKIITLSFLMVIVGLAYGQSGEIVTVKGRGVGEDMASALKDAYRDAIETAVGLYVDAEQMVKNDVLLKDQVLTQSNAYIEGYDVLSKKVGDGMVSIKIIAKVRTKALTKKVSGFMKPRTVEVGSALRDQFAKSQTERKRGEDGAALVKKALSGLNVELQTMDCWLAHPDGDVVNDDGKSTNVKVRYLFGYRINEERFFGLMASLCDVFNQVSMEEPTDILIPVERGAPFVYDAKGSHNTGSAISVKIIAKPSYRRAPGSAQKQEPFVFMLVTGVNKLRSVYKARQYMLDQYSAAVVQAWYRENNPVCSNDKTPRFNVTFNDAGNDPLFQDTIMPGIKNSVDCCDRCTVCVTQGGNALNSILVKPWFQDGMMAASERYMWTETKIPRIAMPEIKRITIEIVK